MAKICRSTIDFFQKEWTVEFDEVLLFVIERNEW